MSEDRNEDLLPLELRPEMQPSETDSASVSSQQPGAYYAPPGYEPPAPVVPATSGRRWAIAGVAAAAVVAVGVWYAMTPAPLPPAPPAVPAHTEEAAGESSGDAAAKATAYLKSVLAAKASGISRGASLAAPGDASSPESQLHAANAAALIGLAETAPEMAKEIREGKRQLYRLRLGDEVEGDVYHVEVYVDGTTLGDIYQGKGDFLVPLMPGRPALLKLVPTLDRGGMGIDVGLILPSNEQWRSGIMKVGQSAQRQITAP